MCATDLDLVLDLELEIAEDERAASPQPAGARAPGVAWGLAKRTGDPVTGGPAAG